MVAAFDYCLHGRAERRPRSTRRCTGWCRPRTSTTCTRTPASRSRPRSTARRSPRSASATGSSGCRGGARASSSVSTSRRSRPRTRRPSAASSAATASPPGVRPPRSARPTPWTSSRTAETFLAERGSDEPFGPVVSGRATLAAGARRARAAALCPVIRGLASTDRPQVGHFTDSDVVLDFLAREKAPALAELGTSCPDHFLRTKVKPLRRRPPRRRHRSRTSSHGWVSCTRPTAPTTPPTTTGTPRRTPRRCAAQTRPSCSCPAWACSPSAPRSRRRAWPASSTSTPST